MEKQLKQGSKRDQIVDKLIEESDGSFSSIYRGLRAAARASTDGRSLKTADVIREIKVLERAATKKR